MADCANLTKMKGSGVKCKLRLWQGVSSFLYNEHRKFKTGG